MRLDASIQRETRGAKRAAETNQSLTEEAVDVQFSVLLRLFILTEWQASRLLQDRENDQAHRARHPADLYLAISWPASPCPFSYMRVRMASATLASRRIVSTQSYQHSRANP